jgi:putative endonuclease
MKLDIGREGEKIALRYLKRLNYKILDKNYRCRFGEIDIIAKDKETFVFIEVKMRRSKNYGPPELAVDKRKREKIGKVALNYITKNNIKDKDMRFDVVAIDMSSEKGDIRLIKNAFEL